jgi:alanine dehydrogenase
MKFGIIRERKNPPDRRVVFSPEALQSFKKRFPQADIVVESSPIRVFSNEAYRLAGFTVTEDLSDCDVLIGVKEVPVDALIANKTYFFFSHTIKKQPYNRKLLQAILQKNITLIDHETIVDAHKRRLIGFGRYAGIVGAYNGFRAFGVKFELFNLPKAETLADQPALINHLRNMVLPPIKIVLTGKGKVGMGAREMLTGMKMKEVGVTDFLNKKYSEPVFVQIDVLEYNQRKDGQELNNTDFYQHPEEYVSNFERFSQVADIFITGHFYNIGAPYILTREMLQSHKNNIKVVADVSCDVGGPIACTLRATTIEQPFMGYHPRKHEEVSYHDPAAIMVMSVDNLPCELPNDASVGFGEMFLQHVIPAFFNQDQDGVLQRATITKNGVLTPNFAYLQDYVDESEMVSN